MIGTRTSRRITSGSPVASASRVAVTPPSTEFSIGTITASSSPARTAASAASTVATGVAVAVSTPGTWAKAISVNVPRGPKYPNRSRLVVDAWPGWPGWPVWSDASAAAIGELGSGTQAG